MAGGGNGPDKRVAAVRATFDRRHPEETVIPLVHDFDGEVVLIFGGGPVGARKARRFAEEARVVVVSPSFTDEAFGESEFVRAAPDPAGVPGWIETTDPALVVAATDDDDLNAAIGRAAREAGVLVNRADRSGGRERGSVVVPATVWDDPVGVAVTTGGTSPAVSRRLRRELESTIEGAGAVATVVADLRAALKARSIDPTRRREAVRAVAGADTVWAVARETGDERRVREVADRIVADALDG
jgi:precorrin-2 dehydrogenase/sirohydrochlorin ferrochelatase